MQSMDKKGKGKKEEDEGEEEDEEFEIQYVPGYRFYDKDSESNIIVEKVKDASNPVDRIMAGTVAKLVERLTYEKYPGATTAWPPRLLTARPALRACRSELCERFSAHLPHLPQPEGAHGLVGDEARASPAYTCSRQLTALLFLVGARAQISRACPCEQCSRLRGTLQAEEGDADPAEVRQCAEACVQVLTRSQGPERVQALGGQALRRLPAGPQPAAAAGCVHRHLHAQLANHGARRRQPQVPENSRSSLCSPGSTQPGRTHLHYRAQIANKLEAGPEKREYQFDRSPPESILPAHLAEGQAPGLLDLAPEEVARQFTLMDYNLFINIKQLEYLYYQKAPEWSMSTEEQKEENTNNLQLSPHVIAVIYRFSDVRDWVATEIVKREDRESRAHVLEHIIQTAEVRAARAALSASRLLPR